MNQVLTHWFSGFLRRRRALRHFSRQSLGDTLARRGPAPPPPEHLASTLLLVARDEDGAAIRRMASHEDASKRGQARE